MTLSTLQSETRRILKVSSSQYPDNEITPALNSYYDRLWHSFLEAEGVWQFSGQQYSTPLVQGQSAYTLPIDWARVNLIEISYSSSTSGFVPLTIIPPEQSSISPQNTEGQTTYAYIVGDTLVLYGSPSSNQGSIKFYVSESPVYLLNQTDEPKIHRNFQKGLIYGACIDYCIIFKKDLVQYFQNEYDKNEKAGRSFYFQRVRGANQIKINYKNCA